MIRREGPDGYRGPWALPSLFFLSRFALILWRFHPDGRSVARKP